jgi:hypothetical protein
MLNRIIFILMIALFFALPQTTLNAIELISPTATPSGQVKAAATETVNAKTVYANQKLNLSIKVPIAYDLLVKFLKFLNADDIEEALIGYAAEKFANIKIANDNIKDTNNKPFSVRWYNVSSSYFTPITVQERTKHAQENPKRKFEIAGKLCIKKPDNSGYIERYSTTNIGSKDDNPDLAIEGLESAETFAAMFAKRKIDPDPNQDNKYNYVKSTQETNTRVDISCEEAVSAINTTTKEDSSTSQNTFVGGGAALFEAAMNAFCSIPGSCVEYPVYWFAAINKPHESSYYCNLASENCTDTVGETPVGNGGGLLTFRPDSIKFSDENNGGPPDQGVDAGGSILNTKTAFPYYDKTYNTNRGAFCMMTPISKQGEVLPERSVVRTTTQLAADGKTNVLAATVDTDPCGGFIKTESPVNNEECQSNDFDGFNPRSSVGGGDGGPIGSLSGFSIAYRNTSCTINDTTAKFVADTLAKPWINSQLSYDNFMKYWKTVQDTSIAHGWNPIFVMTLWLEESAAGGSGFAQLGCRFGWDINENPIEMSNSSSICKQMACLFSHPVQDPNDLQGFMCSYNTGVCKTTTLGSWGFAKNIEFVYPQIAEKMNYIGSHPCAFRK